MGMLGRKSWDRKALFRLRKNTRFGLRSELVLFDPPIRLHKNWSDKPEKRTFHFRGRFSWVPKLSRLMPVSQRFDVSRVRPTTMGSENRKQNRFSPLWC